MPSSTGKALQRYVRTTSHNGVLPYERSGISVGRQCRVKRAQHRNENIGDHAILVGKLRQNVGDPSAR